MARPPFSSMRRLAGPAFVVCAVATLAAGSTHDARHSRGDAPTISVPALLDRYLAGEFDAVVAEVAALDTLDAIIDGLHAHGDRWVGQDATVHLRRELAAATFALEAARLGAWTSWKIRVRQPPLETYQPPDVLRWAPAARLVEWGCERFRRRPESSAVERWWQLGAMAVAERAEDFEFLVGDPENPPANGRDQVFHLEHALARFPDEPRFLLVHALTLDWRTWPETRGQTARWRLTLAMAAYTQVLEHKAIGPEAQVRLAGLLVRAGEPDRAIELAAEAERRTRDRYVVYLARLFTGRAHEAARRPAEAAAAYRRAVATIPGAQSASLALAALLAAGDRRDEAQSVVATSLSEAPFDPWRGYADADDRFWPEIRDRLRLEIRR